MIDTRMDKPQTEETTLLNPLDNLEGLSDRLAKLIVSMPLIQLRKMIEQAFKLYLALPQRYLRSGRSSEIQEKLNHFDELIKLTENLPENVVIYLYNQMITKAGGTEDTSFNKILLMLFIAELKIYDMTVSLGKDIVERLRDLIVICIENNLRKEEEISQHDKRINEQKQYLQELELSRLKKEEELLKKALQITQYENTLSQLAQEKDHRLQELQAYTNKLELARQQEQEERQALEKISSEKEKLQAKLHLTQANFEEMRKKYKSIHPDFDCKGLSEEQFEFIEKFTEQSVLSAIATVKGKVEKEEDLAFLRAQGRVKKGIEFESDVFHKAEEIRLREAKEAELQTVKDSVSAQRQGGNKAIFNNFKKQLSLKLLLGVNKKSQQDIENKQQQLLRQRSLETEGFFTVLPEAGVMKVDFKEDYLPQAKAVKKLSDIKLKQEFQSENKNFMKAYKALNRFFSSQSEEKMLGEKLVLPDSVCQVTKF